MREEKGRFVRRFTERELEPGEVGRGAVWEAEAGAEEEGFDRRGAGAGGRRDLQLGRVGEQRPVGGVRAGRGIWRKN